MGASCSLRSSLLGFFAMAAYCGNELASTDHAYTIIDGSDYWKHDMGTSA